MALLVVLIESAANAFLFRAVMSTGWVGGLASRARSPPRTSRSRRWRPTSGATSTIGAGLEALRACRRGVGIGLCLGFNLGVAHLRDALEAGLELEAALTQSWASLWTAPLQLASFLSALLMLLGIIAAILVGLKTYHAIDPYPGYPGDLRNGDPRPRRLCRDLDRAIADLDASRDAAIEDSATRTRRCDSGSARRWTRSTARARCAPSSTGSSRTATTRRTRFSPCTATPTARPAERDRPKPRARALQPALRFPRDADAAAGRRRPRGRRPRAEAGERTRLRGDRGHPPAYSDLIAAYPSIAALEAEIGGAPRAARTAAGDRGRVAARE